MISYGYEVIAAKSVSRRESATSRNAKKDPGSYLFILYETSFVSSAVGCDFNGGLTFHRLIYLAVIDKLATSYAMNRKYFHYKMGQLISNFCT